MGSSLVDLQESTCNAGDPGSIPGLGRSPGEGIVYPLQYSWASLVVQTVKNPPAMRKRPRFNPWVGKIPWRRAWLPTPVSLPGESPLVGYSPWGHKELDMTERLNKGGQWGLYSWSYRTATQGERALKQLLSQRHSKRQQTLELHSFCEGRLLMDHHDC